MTDAYVAWQLAEAEQQIEAFSSFLAACPWPDPAKRLICRDLADSGREALAGGRLAEALDHLDGLVDHAWEWRDRPGYPRVRQPEEADRQTRDLVKDVLRRDGFPADFRKEVSNLKLSIDVAFGRVRCHPDLDSCTRDSVRYVYGRATMALDLGHVAAAERELARLKEALQDLGARQ